MKEPRYPQENDRTLGRRKVRATLKPVTAALVLKGSSLSAVLDSVPDVAIYRLIHSPDGRTHFEYVSAGFAPLFELSEDIILRDAGPLYGLLHSEDRDDAINAQKASAETGTPFRHECRFNLSSGKTRWVRWHSMPEPLPDGGLVWNGLAIDVSERKHAELALRQTNEELERRVRERTVRLQSLAAELTQVEHKERRRIAHLLHEDLQQRLAAILYKVHELVCSVKGGSALETADWTLLQLSEAIELTRTLTTRLAPPVLYQLGLRPALEALAEEMKAHLSLSVRITGLRTLRLPSNEIQHFAFDSVRELLLNVSKHAGVKCAEIRMRPAGKKRIAVEVRDKGKGIAKKREQTDRFGLFSIRERAEAMGIGFDISSSPGKGTCATLILPSL